MLQYPTYIDPVAFSIFGIRVHWYGIMYLIGFLGGRQVGRHLCRKRFFRMRQEHVDDLLIFLFFGMLLGARLLYMFVYYKPSEGEAWHWYTPLQIWRGGLAFHGGALGMMAGMYLFSRKYKVRFFNVADVLALAAPIGIFFGRLGNFINAELYGRVTDVPWAMRFPIRAINPQTGHPVIVDWTEPRHASQLYEAFGEGFFGLAFIWWLKRYLRYQGELIGYGIAAYGVIRFGVEFFREPDAQLGYYFGFLTMGQILCILIALLGAILVAIANYRKLPLDAPAPGGTDEPLPEPAPKPESHPAATP